MSDFLATLVKGMNQFVRFGLEGNVFKKFVIEFIEIKKNHFPSFIY